VRVTAKIIDDLQDTMRTLRSSDIPVELQFTNMRS
jgi:uncharacterized protein YajQ (UPF0234 family)